MSARKCPSCGERIACRQCYDIHRKYECPTRRLSDEALEGETNG